MLDISPPDALAFLTGGGRTGTLIAEHDWSGTALGPIAGWPQSLKTMLGFLLRSPVPMVMLWGEDGVMLYNDAYSVFAGARHPELLGSRVREGWSEIAAFNDNVMRVGLGGGTLAYRDQELVLDRHGRPEPAWMDLDYSPVLDDEGQPAGVLAIVVETTERVLAQRRETAERERLNLVIEGATDYAILTIDPDRVVTSWSAGAEAALGFRADEIVGQSADCLFTPEDRAGNQPAAEVELARRDGIAPDVRWHQRKDGSRVFLDGSVRPLRDGDGREIGFLKIARDETERRRADEALLESEARFRNMADHAPVMMWVTEPDGHCSYLNKNWYAFTGQSEGEAEGFGWLDATHPDDKPLAERVFLEANAAQVPFRIEYRLRRADGSYRWAIDAAAPRFGERDEFLGYVGSVIDIDERREAEERLRLSEGRFRAAVDAVQGVLWTNDAEGRMTGEQSGWTRLTGQSREDYEGYGWSRAVHPDDAQATVDGWRRSVEARRPFVFEHRLRGRDGHYRLYSIHAIPVFSDTGAILEWVGVHTDISDQREVEERLRRSEASAREDRDRAQGYLQVAEVMLLVLDQDGHIGTINRKGAEILGYDRPEELIGRDWFDLAIPAERRGEVRAVFNRLMAGDGSSVANYENVVCRRDGSERLIAWRNTVLRQGSDRVTGTLSSGDDVTDEREAEARERLLVQEVDHRAKNLLAVVQSVVQLTRSDDIAAFKEAVTGRIQSLARTHGLLAAARWEGADLKQIVADELAPYDRGDDDRAHIGGPAVHLTPAAAQAIALVIHELATNAVKYGALSSARGRVDVSWTAEAQGVRLEWRERGGPPVTVPERRGFGSIVLQTSVERQLRGGVELDWRPEGLACTLRLPSADVLAHGRRNNAVRPAVPHTDMPRADGDGRAILVLEDEALIAAQIEDVLSGAGYRIVGPASRVGEAFDRFYAERPDAALLDINLAGERSFPLAALLRAKQVPFALCTGYGEAAIIPEELRDAPLIAKPFNQEELLRTVGLLFA